MQNREMLTAKEATTAFKNAGLSETTFRKRVKDGIIERHIPEGRERGALYPKAQVVAAIENAAKEPKKVKTIQMQLKTATYGKATPQEMPEIAEVLKTFFSKINIEKRAEWIKRNPNVCSIIKSEDKIVGCAFIMPLEEQKITQILDSLIKPPTRPQDIAPTYEPGKHYTLYIRSVVVLQTVPKLQRRHWAAKLISEIIKEIIAMGEKGIIIDKIYAQTDTRYVEHLLKGLGFSQMVSPIGRKNFMLDIVTSGSMYAMQYKKALSLWLEE